MSYQNITNLVQKALQTFLKAQTWVTLPTIAIYKGIERPASEMSAAKEPVRTLPCIECVCQSAEPEAQFSGSWSASAMVRIICNSDDTDEDTFHDAAAELFDLLITDTIGADLSGALEGFTAQLIVWGPMKWDIVERSWVMEFSFDVHCLPSDIT